MVEVQKQAGWWVGFTGARDWLSRLSSFLARARQGPEESNMLPKWNKDFNYNIALHYIRDFSFSQHRVFSSWITLVKSVLSLALADMDALEKHMASKRYVLKHMYTAPSTTRSHAMRLQLITGIQRSLFKSVLIYANYAHFLTLDPNRKARNIVFVVYLRGMKREEWVAPIPGRPCLTGLL
jgi:hypothetical protein